jgi:hypothetical protein
MMMNPTMMNNHRQLTKTPIPQPNHPNPQGPNQQVKRNNDQKQKEIIHCNSPSRGTKKDTHSPHYNTQKPDRQSKLHPPLVKILIVIAHGYIFGIIHISQHTIRKSRQPTPTNTPSQQSAKYTSHNHS